MLEFCGRGTLDTMLHHGSLGTGGASGRRADMQKLLLMMRGIARGMVHLHTRRPPILHRDLKPGERPGWQQQHVTCATIPSWDMGTCG